MIGLVDLARLDGVQVDLCGGFGIVAQPLADDRKGNGLAAGDGGPAVTTRGRKDRPDGPMT